mmetsp:Transcript_23972/g.34479  ORF Transcript_23972/g.34479 Transcript_23972/m.34479 type:complete len:245 (-) Transcript_23972:260-994(-)
MSAKSGPRPRSAARSSDTSLITSSTSNSSLSNLLTSRSAARTAVRVRSSCFFRRSSFISRIVLNSSRREVRLCPDPMPMFRRSRPDKKVDATASFESVRTTTASENTRELKIMRSRITKVESRLSSSSGSSSIDVAVLDLCIPEPRAVRSRLRSMPARRRTRMDSFEGSLSSFSWITSSSSSELSLSLRGLLTSSFSFQSLSARGIASLMLFEPLTSVVSLSQISPCPWTENKTRRPPANVPSL